MCDEGAKATVFCPCLTACNAQPATTASLNDKQIYLNNKISKVPLNIMW